MDEFLVLVVPAAIALGWWTGRWYYTQKYLINHTESLRQAYCKGLNYLLSEKTDKAIDTFADLLASDVETIETHVALGNLFRRRGEVEKAIEIHEELVRRDSLTEEQRVNAQYELGVDYLRSGLYDRAEMILANLVDRSTHRRPALELLLLIYQQERDWQKALQCVADLNAVAKSPRGESESQFLCEMATQAIRAGQDVRACDFVTEALAKNPHCFRAMRMKAELFYDRKDYAEAFDLMRSTEERNSVYLPEVLNLVVDCSRQLGRPDSELRAYLGELYGRYGQDQIAVCLADLIGANEGDVSALTYLREVAQTNPTLRVLRALVGQLVKTEETEGSADVYRLMEDSLERLLQRQSRYRCNQCGFSGQELHWRCPSCRQWESTVPV